MNVERSALNVERSAPRICEALRAAGIEVWLDQRELRGALRVNLRFVRAISGAN